jgi:hypothetical protein
VTFRALPSHIPAATTARRRTAHGHLSDRKSSPQEQKLRFLSPRPCPLTVKGLARHIRLLAEILLTVPTRQNASSGGLDHDIPQPQPFDTCLRTLAA